MVELQSHHGSMLNFNSSLVLFLVVLEIALSERETIQAMIRRLDSKT